MNARRRSWLRHFERRLTSALLAFVLSLGCAQAVTGAPIRVDHIMVGASDLESAIAEMTRLTGVRPVFGGVHPGRGTRNALLSVGSHTYLEIYAPNPAEPNGSEDVGSLRRLRKLTPIGWAVSSPDLALLEQRARQGGLKLTTPEAGSRRLPDGTVLHWSTFGYEDFQDTLAPFFIHWNDMRLHPSRTSPGGCQLQHVRIEDPAAAQLRRAIDPLRVSVEVVKSRTHRMTVRLRCPKGQVTLG